MFTKSPRLNTILSVAFFFAIAGCGDLGSGCGCSVQPLPGGALPADQTVEGGGQIRVTQAGFQKLTSIIPPLLNDLVGEGFCIPRTEVGDADGTLGTGAFLCYQNDNQCTPGCDVDVFTDFITLGVTNNQTLNIQAQFDLDTDAPIDFQVVGIGGSCTLGITGNNVFVDMDIAFGIDPASGELQIELASINSTQLNLDFSGCGLASSILNLVTDFLDSFLGQALIDLLTPIINDLMQGFLPDPLGIEGLIDIGGLVGGISPGTEASMEARMVPGGYVSLNGGGMSLGLITGLNADEDITTRTPDLDSEPHYCVPPIPAPNFASPPASLPATTRGTFTLQPAGEFLGAPEPADDLAIGISETTLDLGGHHAVTSGAMCLGVGTNLIDQLNLGVFSLLVPSLALLGDGGNPVLLVTRPTKALDFAVGDGTTESPAISIDIQDFETDIYVFVYERYTRAFTMKLDMNIGVNLTFDQQPGMPATVTPELVGLDADNITVEVLNNEFVAESKDDLEAVLPTIFDLAVGLLGDGLGSIEVPDFAGFTLNNLRIQHVVTSEDDFLAIYASLGSSSALRGLTDKFPSLGPVLDKIDTRVPLQTQPRAETPVVRGVRVDTPVPSEVRLALKGHPDAEMPTVSIDVPAFEGHRELEYAWRLGGGMWRPYRPGGTLTISDRAFAWQGKYTIEIRSRVRGDYTTTSEITAIPVIIDSVAPEILVDEVTFDGDLVAPARDVVSPASALRWAWGHPADEEPGTDWASTSAVARDVVEDLALDGQIAVYVRDEAGNVRRTLLTVPFHGQAGESGCNCDASSGAPSTGTLALILMTVGLFFRRRVVAVVRRHGGWIGLWVAMAAVSSLVPACNCGGDPGVMYCEVTEDCELECPAGQIPFCLDGVCTCLTDVPYGRIGPYSDIAVASTGDAWISSYNETHGDLVVGTWPDAGRVANEVWEWVDGVPDGPVAIPESDIRGGILEKGPDVGMYTSIAVQQPGDVPVVTYFDVDAGSLKYAAKNGDAWDIHVIDDGTGEIDPELGGETAGMYSALTLRTDDGRPGVAYMALVSDGAGVVRAEVRFAAAQSPNPSTSSDWVFWTVDTAVLPPVDPENVDPHPIPGGLGLFLDATRDAQQAPIVVYYDRLNGDLKLARFDATAGTFLEPQVLAGADGSDVGWYPSVALDESGAAHVSYLSATRDDLLYVNTIDNTPVLIDDGYRIVGTTDDGLPKPEFHFVGDDSNMVLSPAGPAIIYQDATTHELLYSARNAEGTWQRRVLAGDEAEFVGAYGFFASAARFGDEVVISNWVIDQPHADQWVEIFREIIVVE